MPTRKAWRYADHRLHHRPAILPVSVGAGLPVDNPTAPPAAAFALAGAGHIGNTFPPLSNWFRLRGVACLLARFVSHIFDRTIGLMAESESA